jgi:hypothetical protein
VEIRNFKIVSRSILQKIGGYSFDKYLDLVRSFHGFASSAPVIGGLWLTWPSEIFLKIFFRCLMRDKPLPSDRIGCKVKVVKIT